MRILGIDPGLTRCGVGVIDAAANRTATFVAVEVIRTSLEQSIDQRLLGIAEGIDRFIDLYRPDAVAVERVFAQQNVRTVMGTAQASGVAVLAAARHGLPLELHTPSEIKAAITGYGAADKKQVGVMVARILRLTEVPKPADAADSLAIAICHAWRRSAPGTLAAAQTHGGSEPTPAQKAWLAAEKASQSSVARRKLAR